MNRSSRLLFSLCAAYGPAMVAMHYLTWGVGRLALGHWPRPSIDDPLSIPAVWAPYWATMGLTLLLPVAILFPLGAALLAREPGVMRRLAATTVVWLMLIVSILFLRWDPNMVAVWYAD